MKKITLLLLSMLLTVSMSCSDEGTERNMCNEQQISTETSTKEMTEIDTTEATESVTEPLKLFQFDESNIPVLDENDYAIDDKTLITDELIVYKPIVNATETYYDLTYETITFPENFSPMCCDDKGIWYSSFYEYNGVGGNGGIISYNPETGELSEVLDPEGDTACTCLMIEGDYMIWEEATNEYWFDSSYHIYNLSTGESKKFYEAATDPQNGTSYFGFHFNLPIIIDNKIYYDDIVGYFEEGSPHKIVYCYDIIEDKWTVLYDNATRPLEYQGEVSWFSKSNDSSRGVFCNSNGAIYESGTRLGSSPGAAGNMIFMNDFLSKNDYISIKNQQEIKNDDIDENDMFDMGRSSYGVKILREGKAEPIVLSGSVDASYVSNLESNERFLTWGGYLIGNPMLYDCEKDVIINIDFVEDKDIEAYSFKFYQDKLLLSYITATNENECILLAFKK